MYQMSPMENFNKNNPFIVVSKRKYDKIMDDIQMFSANCIRDSIINLAIWLFNLILGIIYIYNTNDYIFLSSAIIILLIFNLLNMYQFRRKLKYFISLHPNMKEFDRISSLEVNNILALNNEDVLKCLHGLYELNGELISTKRYYHIGLIIYGLIESVIAIIICLKIIF